MQACRGDKLDDTLSVADVSHTIFRILYLQACRGEKLDDGAKVKVIEPPEGRDVADAVSDPVFYEITPSPLYQDFLMMHATPPGI